MAKGIYIGVDDKARKVKSSYVGVDGKARKIKKGYIGIGGVARPFLGEGKLEYYGTVNALTDAREDHAAGNTGDYALFYGGYQVKYWPTTVEGYSRTLTKVSAPDISYPYDTVSDAAAASIDNLAIFAGGYANGNGYYCVYVDMYDNSLTKTRAENLSVGRYSLAGAAINNTAIFAGGKGSATNPSDVVEAYTSDGTRTLLSPLSAGRRDLAAARAGNYALFAGGYARTTSGFDSTAVDVYDSSLTKVSSDVALVVGIEQQAAASVSKYALFAGGYNMDMDYAMSDVNCIDSSLTRISVDDLSQYRQYLAGTTLEGYAIFAGGGYSGTIYDNVDVYDTSLTHTAGTPLSVARSSLAAATVGNYALFGGGWTTSAANTVDAYTIV